MFYHCAQVKRASLVVASGLNLLLLSSACAQKAQKKPHNVDSASANTDAGDEEGPAADQLDGNAPGQAVIDSPQGSPEAGVPIAFSTDEALSYLIDTCGTCHNHKSGAAANFWALNPDAFGLAALAGDPLAPAVYFATAARAKGISAGKPAPMPPGGTLSDEAQRKLQRLSAWFAVALPDVVSKAKEKFAAATPSEPNDVRIVLDYACKEPITGRQYLARVTNDLFDRPPTPAEVASLGEAASKAAAAELRGRIAERLSGEWASQFMSVTLQKFASNMVGAHIRPMAGISEEQAKDLGQEFYQLLLARAENEPYTDLLFGSRIMVSAATASLYGCVAPAKGRWEPCQMKSPRDSFFTSMSFLASAPTSFLVANNNYGRVKLLHFFLTGNLFLATTDAPANDDKLINPLPQCLQTNDYRGLYDAEKTNVAPYGAAAIPASSNFCQTCHIARHMAAGSILFRPFDAAGREYTPINLGFDLNIDEAVNELHVYKAGEQYQRVTLDYLKALLTDKREQACAAAPSANTNPKILAGVRDLARLIAGDGYEAVMTGLARHLPRTLGNRQQTSDEIIERVRSAYKAKQGNLREVVKAYIISDTYACKER